MPGKVHADLIDFNMDFPSSYGPQNDVRKPASTDPTGKLQKLSSFVSTGELFPWNSFSSDANVEGDPG